MREADETHRENIEITREGLEYVAGSSEREFQNIDM